MLLCFFCGCGGGGGGGGVIPTATPTLLPGTPTPTATNPAIQGKALIISPYDWQLGSWMTSKINTVINWLTTAGMPVTELRNAQQSDTNVTLNSFLALANYSLVYINTHGGIFNNGTNDIIFLASGEESNYTTASAIYSAGDFQDGSVVLCTIPEAGLTATYYAITPNYITKHYTAGSFNNTLLVVCACHGGENTSLADAFIARGNTSTSYMGWTNAVYTNTAYTAETALFNYMINDGHLNNGDALASIPLADRTDATTGAQFEICAGSHTHSFYGSSIPEGGSKAITPQQDVELTQEQYDDLINLITNIRNYYHSLLPENPSFNDKMQALQNTFDHFNSQPGYTIELIRDLTENRIGILLTHSTGIKDIFYIDVRISEGGPSETPTPIPTPPPTLSPTPITLNYHQDGELRYKRDLGTPGQAAMDANGTLYVLDINNYLVKVLPTEEEEPCMTFGGYGEEDGKFIEPTSILLLGEVVFVLDRFKKNVQKFNKTTGAYIQKYDLTDMGDPVCMAYLPESSTFFVTDDANHNIRAYQNNFTQSFTFGENNLQHPYGIACDEEYIYVTDKGKTDNPPSFKIFNNDYVLKATIYSVSSIPFNNPGFVSAGRGPIVAFADTRNNRIIWVKNEDILNPLKYNAFGQGDNPCSFDYFQNPTGVLVLQKANNGAETILGVSDSGNKLLKSYNYLAEEGNLNYLGSVFPCPGEFYEPKGIYFDDWEDPQADNVVIVDEVMNNFQSYMLGAGEFDEEIFTGDDTIQFCHPADIVKCQEEMQAKQVHGKQTIYFIVDKGNSRIIKGILYEQVMGDLTQYTTIAGQKLEQPYRIVTDESNLYLLDSGNSNLFKFDKNVTGGTYSNLSLTDPVGLGIHSNTLYVLAGDHVYKYSTSDLSAQGNFPINLEGACDLDVSPQGNVYICSNTGNGVAVYDSSGNPINILGIGNDKYYGIAVAPDQAVYLTTWTGNYHKGLSIYRLQ